MNSNVKNVWSTQGAGIVEITNVGDVAMIYHVGVIVKAVSG
jgi:hypothetical protein